MNNSFNLILQTPKRNIIQFFKFLLLDRESEILQFLKQIRDCILWHPITVLNLERLSFRRKTFGNFIDKAIYMRSKMLAYSIFVNKLFNLFFPFIICFFV